MRWLETWGSIVQDARYGLRQLRKRPGFAIVAVLTLALGIGVTTAMFTVVDGVLLRPLAFPEPDRLVAVGIEAPEDATGDPMVRPDHYAEIRRGVASFANVATYVTNPPTTFTQVGDAARVTTTWVSEDFFEVLGVAPSVGRSFGQAADSRVDNAVVVLGNGLWRSRFGGDPSVVGSAALLDGVPRTIMGVMPPGFDFPERTDLWLPLEAHPLSSAGPALWGPVISRLGEGTSLAQATSELEALAANAGWRLGRGDDSPTVRVLQLEDVLVGESRYPLMIFSGAVALVLLISVTNVANLLLMRAETREAEIGLRKVMGADEPRLVRQLLTESLMLAGGAGVLGIGIAVIGVQALLGLAPPGTLPRGQELEVDLTVLGFTLIVSLATGVAFGLAPALKLGRRELHTVLGGGSRAHTRGRGLGRGLLVVSELGLALVLLTGATLLGRSFQEIRSIELGFEPANTMSFYVDLPVGSYSEIEPTLSLHQRVLSGLASIPGVQDVGAANYEPFGGATLSMRVRADDEPETSVGAVWMPASSDYFQAMGITMISGRSFAAQEDASAPGVTVLSRTLAELLWPDGDPLGRRIVLGPESTLTVVGVVEDIVGSDPTAERGAMMFQPLAQVQDARHLQHMSYVVRAPEPTSSLVTQMREVMRQADPDIPVERFASLDQLVVDSLADRVFQTRVLQAFAVMALLLAAIGVYGVMAYSVNERTREMGIRIALGARPGHVIGTTISRMGTLLLAGVVVGTLGAYAAARLMTAWLYAVSPRDPATYAVSVLILVGVALLAALGPVRRAMRVSPVEVLTE